MKKLFVLLGILILVSAFYLAFPASPQERYSLTPTGLVAYSGLAPPPYTATSLPGGEKKIVFESRGQQIHALFALPEGKGPFPAFIVLPGGNVGKEAEHQGIARDLRALGFATLTLDQRGIGETGGPFPPLEEQAIELANRNEPVYHKMVADAVSASRLLSSFPEINKEKISLAGVSMGGRIAIIAGAQEPGIMGVLAVSTAGYSLPPNLPEDQGKFFASINPDEYIQKLSRPLVMIHSRNDPVVAFSEAQKTFSLASQPKSFLSSEEGGHGYYTQFHKAFLEQAVSGWKE